MPKDFDLNSQRWLDLVFVDKNKEYGAYIHREESSDRHLKALIIITFIALGLIFLPKLIKTMMPAQKELTQTTMVDLSNIDINQEVPEENQMKEVVVPPPPELKSTVQYVPPVIVDDAEIAEDDVILTQLELTETTATISVATVVGSETGTVDIQDLVDHKVITEDTTKPQIYDITGVQVEPSFPLGDPTLWLMKNMRYPAAAEERGVNGRVGLRFVVTPTGSIEDVIITRTLDPSCDREAKRAVESMPKWNPGKQNGNPVYVYFHVSIWFKIDR